MTITIVSRPAEMWRRKCPRCQSLYKYCLTDLKKRFLSGDYTSCPVCNHSNSHQDATGIFCGCEYSYCEIHKDKCIEIQKFSYLFLCQILSKVLCMEDDERNNIAENIAEYIKQEWNNK